MSTMLKIQFLFAASMLLATSCVAPPPTGSKDLTDVAGVRSNTKLVGFGLVVLVCNEQVTAKICL